VVAGQNVAVGRLHQHRTVRVTVSDTTLAMDLDDRDVKVVRRTTTPPSVASGTATADRHLIRSTLAKSHGKGG
jgi:hypothetical protein